MSVAADWSSAAFVSPVEELDGAPVLRTTLVLDGGHGDVTAAVLHASALGVFEASIDGVPVDDDVLSPGWSSYEWRLRYRTYDVTSLVRDGAVLAMALGNGWYRGRLGWSGRRALYGDRLAAIATLEVTFADGHRQVVATDATWVATASDTTANDLYDGQTIDARRRGVASHDVAVEVLDVDRDRLTPYIGPPVRRHEVIPPVREWTSPSGRHLVDLGQNLVGWLRVRASGPAGTVVTVRHAEVLEHDELGTRPLRTAEATDRFVLSGSGEDVFEPTSTFHGFRYVEVDGREHVSSIEAVVVHSDMARTGRFECSDDDVNRLHENVVWGWRGNALDVPTDCPQRDERLGWTGDLAVFAPTAAYLYDVEGFLRDWLRDVAAEQAHADGEVPRVVPDILKMHDTGITMDSPAIWSDAAVWVTWALWQAYGDVSVLDAQYESMVAHVRRVASLAEPDGLRVHGFQFADWLDPDAPPDQPWAAKADPRVVANACKHRSERLVAEAARLTGRLEDAAELDAMAALTKASFLERYVDVETGHVKSDAPTVYALAIVFGLVEGDVARRAGDRLASLVAANGHRIGTGFAGTPYVTDALTMTGHVDDAYALLLQRERPSWLYTVSMGATTIWERWDSMLPDGTINPGEMTSFNHYALGAVADWLHRTVGGIAPLEPGYRRVLVAPRPGGGLTWARTSLETRHGRVAVSWRLDGEDLTVDVELPEGVTGVLALAGEPSVDLAGACSLTAKMC